MLGTIGLVCFGLGSLGMLYLAVIWVVRLFDTSYFTEPLHNRPLLLYSVAALLLGAQMMTSGFLAEQMTAYHSRNEDSYSIAEQTGRGPWSGLRGSLPATGQPLPSPPANLSPPATHEPR
jgi:hypothetical protein